LISCSGNSGRYLSISPRAARHGLGLRLIVNYWCCPLFSFARGHYLKWIVERAAKVAQWLGALYPSTWQSPSIELSIGKEERVHVVSLDLCPAPPSTPLSSLDLLPAFNSTLAILPRLPSLAITHSSRPVYPLALAPQPTPGHSFCEESLFVRPPPSSPSGLSEQTSLHSN
jgi:hypothetical protein